MASAFPVGTVLIFAGDLSVGSTNLSNITAGGWLICDGTAYDKVTYAALYTVIGTTYGTNGSSFLVPNYQDKFLRGTLGKSTNNTDPDASLRTSFLGGSAAGNLTGTLQASATALPKSPWRLKAAAAHSHNLANLSKANHHVWAGTTYNCVDWAANNAAQVSSDDGLHFHQMGGFDIETAPVNLRLHFIIKATTGAETVASGINTPSGTIAAFAGNALPINSEWSYCDGSGIPNNSPLFNNIVYNFGGDHKTFANLPDLRGYFLRGCSQTVLVDKDAASRTALQSGGNAGDKVGSVQGYATGNPANLVADSAGDHHHTFPKNLGVAGYHNASVGVTGAHILREYNSDTWPMDLQGIHTHSSILGGDKETRPVNASVDYLIATLDLPEAPPIGTIISYGGDTTDQTILNTLLGYGWLPCNGSGQMKANYQSLFDAIGTMYGIPTGTDFGLPDLRGMFVRGAGPAQLGKSLGQSMTGTPKISIYTSSDGLHHHTPVMPTNSHMMDVVSGNNIAAVDPTGAITSDNGAHTHLVDKTAGSGDSESRPVNVYVNYIIRAK